MAKETFHGPLEQVDACCWRIPKSYKPGMRVDGLIFANERLIEQTQAGPGAGAGRQRGVPAGHPDGQPGHARHPLGLRLLHRRRLRHRSGRRRRHLARRRRLRHQLRRAPDAASNLSYREVKPHLRNAGRRAVQARCRPASASSGRYTFDGKELQQLLGEGSQLPGRPGPGHAGRHRLHRGAAAGSTAPSPTTSADHALQSRRRAVRHARLRQPFPGSAGRRSRLRRGGRRRDGPGKGHGLRHDPLRLAAAWATRCATTPWSLLRKVPEKYGIELPDRQLACAPVNSPEGPEVHRRHAGGGQLRLVQPPAADVAGPRGLRRRLRPDRGRSCR